MSRQKPKPHTKTLGIATTLAAAASITGLSDLVVSNARDAGCRAFKANGRIDCDALLEFATTDKDFLEKAENAPDFQLEKALDMRANRRLKEQKLRERDKLLIPIENARRAWFRNVIACKTKLYQAENSISVEVGLKFGLDNEKVNQLKEIIMKHQRLAIREMFQGEFGKAECPQCKEEIKP